MLIRIVLVLFLIVSIWPAGVKAQDSTFRVNIASPNAASLGKYGDIPVSYQSGTPSISIPIYTASSGHLKHDISLSYHASGLKVQELASWVGTGWSLNAGGVITRAVRGGPDDRGFSTSNYSHGHYADYGYNSYLLSGANTIDDYNFARGFKDGEPDIFTFNFDGYVGKFYFDDDRRAVLVPQSDFRIETDYSAANGGFQGFVITVSNGTKYYFGKTGNTGTTDPIEISNPCTLESGPSNTTLAVSSWFLNKIVSDDGAHSIHFEYEEENYSYYTLSMFPILSDEVQSGTLLRKREYDLVKNLVQGVRLSQITFPNGEINFVPTTSARTDLSGYTTQGMYDYLNTEAKALAEINITNNADFCKKFQFSYGYFTSTQSLTGELATGFAIFNINSDKNRLRLDAVQELSCNSQKTVPPYQFTYFTESTPRGLSFGIDHWGYYNGVNSNNSLIPAYTENNGSTIQEIPGANREPAWPAMRAGTLKQIRYPTNGYTEFEFEPHSITTNHTEYAWSTVLGMSRGFDGNASITTSYLTANSDPYNVVVNNTSIHSAVLKIFDPSNVLVQNLGANPSSTATFNFSLTSGVQYRIELSLATGGNPNPTGTGATVTFRQWGAITVNQDQIIGGIRIKKITSSEGSNLALNITNLSYNSGAQSTGILYSRPVYVQTLRNDNYQLVWPYCGTGGCASCLTGQPYLISPSSVTPLATFQGGHIGYNQVTVAQTGNGYTQYGYYGSNTWDAINKPVTTKYINTSVCNSNDASFPYAPAPFEIQRGDLKYVKQYRQDGQLLSDESYTYEYVQLPSSTPAYIVAIKQFMVGTEYELRSFRNLRTTTVSKTYDPVTSSFFSKTSTDYYWSSFHTQTTRSVSIVSASDSIATNYKYAFDFQPPSCLNIPTGLAQYQADVAAAETYLYNNIYTCSPQVSNASNCRHLVFQQYQINKANARISYTTTRRNGFVNAGNTYATNHSAAKSAADGNLKPLLELQDVHRNALIEASSWRNNKLTAASFNKYEYVSNPANTVQQAQLRRIIPASLGTNFAVAMVNGSNGLTLDNRYETSVTLKFHAGQMVEMKGEDGVLNSYVYGYNNNYPIVHAVGVNFTTLSAAYAAVSGNLQTLRSQPSLASAYLSTYGYKPLVGLLWSTDARGRDSKFEYDALGRLVVMRDHDNTVRKVYCYNYAGQTIDCAVPCSVTTPAWQNTSTAIRCKLDGAGNPTGEQEQEQEDINPCSSSFGQLQWFVVGTDETACPVQETCKPSECVGDNKKCVNGNCETGTLVCVSSVKISKFVWRTTYRYCFSDGSYSTYSLVLDESEPCLVFVCGI